MSLIEFRVTERSEAIDRHVLLDIFHLGNLRFSKRINPDDRHWWESDELELETEQDYFHPILAPEVLAEYISDTKSDGFIVHLDHKLKKRSYKKANTWLKNIHDGHIDLIRDMGWDVYFYIGRNPQHWISKTFIKHAKRLKLNVYGSKMKKVAL